MSIRYWAGSKSAPKICFSQSSSRSSSVPPTIAIAAMATPIWLPMPPSTTIARITALSRKVNDSGLMKFCRAAKKAPAKPPKPAPIAKAVSLVLVVLMPSERQAISSSRSASHARPTGRRRSRIVTRLVISARHQDHVEEKDRPMQRRELEPEGRGEARIGRVERDAEEARSRDSRDARIAAGDVDPVDQDEADDLAERERHDGEVVAAQAQHREAEDDAPEGREDSRDRQPDPERPGRPEPWPYQLGHEILDDVVGGEQRVGIGADRIERDVAEVEQARRDRRRY